MSINYQPETCHCCGQDKTYILAIDKGTVRIVKQIADFIGRKGINVVHPRKEMEGRGLSSNEVGNLTRARVHGLIAKVRGEKGNYLLTRKGVQFLKGEPIPQYAIVRKGTGEMRSHNDGYYEAEKYQVRVWDFNTATELWAGINYEITEGRVIHRLA